MPPTINITISIISSHLSDKTEDNFLKMRGKKKSLTTLKLNNPDGIC